MNFIKVYNNVFDKTYCDNVIEYWKRCEEVGLTQDRTNVSKMLVDDKNIYIPYINLAYADAELYSVFIKGIWNCYHQYADEIPVLKELDSHQIHTVKLQKTKPRQGYHGWHCEAGTRNTSNILLVWTVYLNDNFEAGETEFLYQSYRYKPKQGDVVIFPSAFTHTHRGNPPINGDKYILTGWIEF